MALFPVVLPLANPGVLDVALRHRSARALAERLPALSPETELGCLECFPNGLTFYLGRTVTLISRDGDELTSNYILSLLAREPQWPTNVVRRSEFAQWLDSRKTPVYLIVRPVDRAELETRGATVQELSRDWLGGLLPAAGLSRQNRAASGGS